MNILHVNTMDSRGGAANIASSIHFGLKARGHRSDMFVKLKYTADDSVHEARWPNPLNKALRTLTGKDFGSAIANRIRPLLSNDIEWFKTDKILDTEEFKRADVIHCHNLHGNYFKLETLVKMSELKPVVWTLHDTWAITPHCARLYPDGAFSNGFYACRNLNEYQNLAWDNTKHLIEKKKDIYSRLRGIRIIAPSRWLLEKARQSVLGDKKISLIQNGVDTDVFKPTDKKEARKTLGLPENKKIILYLSATGAETSKGFGYVRAMREKHFKDGSVLFVCVVDKKGESDIAGQSIRFVDYIDDKRKIADYFSAADALLYPSLADSFGLVAAEALACGTPVVTFKTGGLPEIIVHKENGYVAEYEDAADLFRGVEYVLKCPQKEIENMAKKSVERAGKFFRIDSMIENYVALYARLIGEKMK